MTIEDFQNKLYNYAPRLLMDYVKSKIRVIFMDQDGILYKTDMITRGGNGLSLWMVYFDDEKLIDTAYGKPDINDHINYCKSYTGDMNKIFINLPPINGEIIDAKLEDKDPFESHESLCFKIIKENLK